ncbi:pentatricopeptide repeat-containing protein At2g01510, mitochondrial-like [Macadamia integrifolia]|uniref:pentatricopeptide repeat-containing protein At2g01510, mitochondrial-like n=1 Tax=Macadamia integrifolia TaxID=60698 RepID=UPI001C5335C5|nr:pentatricopeptide repeat-containing protein At2g01510, mitochondrial-like [Macadamia integrifolia]
MELGCVVETKHLKSSLSTQSFDSCKSPFLLRQLHAQILKSPHNPSNLNLATKLVASYGKFGDLESAHLVFDRYPRYPDAFLFNSLIQAHISNSLFLKAIDIYVQMIEVGTFPNQYTFPLLFRACASSFMLHQGIQIHAHAAKFGFISNPFVVVSLMNAYMKNGVVDIARQLFDGMVDRDIVSWNALLTGYSQNGWPEEALEVFNRMREENVDANFVSVASVIAACSQLRFLNQGKSIHSWALKSGFNADVVVGTALLDMYASSGDTELAGKVFEEMLTKDLIAWNCLISCYCQNGLIDDSFSLFVEMQNTGLKPNGSTLAGILPAVARLGAVHLSKSCHGFIIRNRLDMDEYVLTALMDVYAKSGDLVAAHRLFDLIPKRSVVAWSSMIFGYGTHGCGAEALMLFEKRHEFNVKPNYITYIGVLSACAHAGLVKEGREYFRRMVDDHGITPSVQHYACMVDMFSRAGNLDEAMDLITVMPVEPSPGIWGALLGGCRIHGHVELGKYAAERLFELNSSDPGFYVLLSNMYAAAGMWSEVQKVRGLMKEKGLRKPAGWSSVEIGNKVHSFVSGDMSHSDSNEIYQKLDELMEEIGRVGYIPETKVVLHDVEDNVKENVLRSHSEKLAMAYGLLRAAPGVPIRIMKNLRTCEDCHSAAKFISKITGREIVLRDSVRFHHVREGVCTCRDYW